MILQKSLLRILIKLQLGGIPRGSYLILVPNDYRGIPLHFTLLRVSGVSPTPLSNHVQQTYFELHKKIYARARYMDTK